MTQSEEINGITWQLAAMDALPVLFFGAAMLMLGFRLHSVPFAVGTLVCTLSGAAKLAWKLLLALCERDIKALSIQLKLLMPLGFVLVVWGMLASDANIVQSLARQALRPPCILFFGCWLFCMGAMVLVGQRFNRYRSRDNWIAQTVNTVAQACLLLGVLLLG